MNPLNVSQTSYQALEKFSNHPHLGKSSRTMTKDEVTSYANSVRDGFQKMESRDWGSHTGHVLTNLPQHEDFENHMGSTFYSATGGRSEGWVDPSHHRYVTVDEKTRSSDYEVLTPSGGQGYSGGGFSADRQIEFGVETPAYIAGMQISEREYGDPQFTAFKIDQRHPEKSVIETGYIIAR